MGLLASAGSFNPQDGSTIREEDVVMKQRGETRRTTMRKKKQNITKEAL